jgi:hypothetical protein
VGKGSAPDPPDYAAAAEEQGKANVQSAIASNFLNQVGQVGPNGSLNYSYDYNNGYTLPDGTKIPGVTATTTLSPQQQALYNQNNQISQSMNNIALQGLEYAGDTVNQPIDLSQVAGQVKNIPGQQFQNTFGDAGDIGTEYDFSQVSQMPEYSDFNATRDKVTDAYMQRLQPYLDKERAALDQRLAGQGITHGSEAYGWDNDVFNRGANDQRIAALLSGDKAAQDLFNNAMSLRGQGVSEAIAQGNFGNQAQQQAYAQAMGRGNFQNQAAEAAFAQGLAGGQFQNQARQQGIEEQAYMRNEPINIINALRSGNQVNMPQFGNVAGGSQIAPAPIYNATGDQYSAEMAQFNANQQGMGGFLGGLAGLGSAAITKWSDRRLKSNIVPLMVIAGNQWYAYDIAGKREFGVMADEVPHAHGPVVGGFQTVNYGEL